ncbi:MAG: SoxR reducing system RseC family protein [Fibrobacterota bacterium]
MSFKAAETAFRPGVVERRTGQTLHILLDPAALRSVCSNKGCNACQAEFSPLRIRVHSTDTDLRAGDTVVVSLLVLNEALSAFITFIIPIIGALIFYILSVTAFGRDGNSLSVVMGTMAVFSLTLVLITFSDRLIRKISPPHIVETTKRNKL